MLYIAGFRVRYLIHQTRVLHVYEIFVKKMQFDLHYHNDANKIVFIPKYIFYLKSSVRYAYFDDNYGFF